MAGAAAAITTGSQFGYTYRQQEVWNPMVSRVEKDSECIDQRRRFRAPGPFEKSIDKRKSLIICVLFIGVALVTVGITTFTVGYSINNWKIPPWNGSCIAGIVLTIVGSVLFIFTCFLVGFRKYRAVAAQTETKDMASRQDNAGVEV